MAFHQQARTRVASTPARVPTTDPHGAARGTRSASTVELESADAVIGYLDQIRSAAAQNPTYAFDEPWPLFIRKMRLLTAQSYGSRIQNRLAAHFGWDVVPSSMDRGDVRDRDGAFHEVKTTVITAAKTWVNFVQIRPHQEIAGYHLFVVERDYTLVHLWLSRDQMAAEIEGRGCSSHGTAGAVRDNRTREYSIRFDWDHYQDTTAARWRGRYTVASAHP